MNAQTVVRLAYGHPSGAAFSPLNRHSFALTGSDPYLRIYDIRMFSDSPLDEDDALKMFAPSLSRRHGTLTCHIYLWLAADYCTCI